MRSSHFDKQTKLRIDPTKPLVKLKHNTMPRLQKALRSSTKQTSIDPSRLISKCIPQQYSRISVVNPNTLNPHYCSKNTLGTAAGGQRSQFRRSLASRIAWQGSKVRCKNVGLSREGLGF